MGFTDIGEHRIDGVFLAFHFFRIQADREIIEQHRRAHGADGIRRGGSRGLDIRNAITQFECALQVNRAPRAGFGLIAQLLECISQQILGVLIGRIGEYDMLHHFGDPAVIVFLEGFTTLADGFGFAAHRLHITWRDQFRRQIVEIGRIAGIPAHVALINRTRIVTQRAVVATGTPLVLQ